MREESGAASWVRLAQAKKSRGDMVHDLVPMTMCSLLYKEKNGSLVGDVVVQNFMPVN